MYTRVMPVDTTLCSFWSFYLVQKKGSFGKGSSQKSPLSRDSRESEILEIVENPETLENKGKADHFSTDPAEVRGFRDSEIPQLKRPLS